MGHKKKFDEIKKHIPNGDKLHSVFVIQGRVFVDGEETTIRASDWHGNIESIVVFDRALTTDEVNSLHDKEQP